MPTLPPRHSTPPTHPGFSPRRPRKRDPGTLVSAPRGEKNKGEIPTAPLPSRLWRHLGAGKAGRGRDTLEPADGPRRCWEGGGGVAARVREGPPKARPANPAALTCYPGSFATYGGVSVCVAVFAVSPTPPHIRILSESEVILRSRHLSLTLSASSAPQRACLRCPVFRSVWVRKESDTAATANRVPAVRNTELVLFWFFLPLWGWG